MTRAKNDLDKNLSGVVRDLGMSAVNSHDAQQQQQEKNDRRHQDALNHDDPPDLSPHHSNRSNKK
ncbi:hypothetical protein AB6A23_27350 [Paenibacillus tarimensis]